MKEYKILYYGDGASVKNIESELNYHTKDGYKLHSTILVGGIIQYILERDVDD